MMKCNWDDHCQEGKSWKEKNFNTQKKGKRCSLKIERINIQVWFSKKFPGRTKRFGTYFDLQGIQLKRIQGHK